MIIGDLMDELAGKLASAPSLTGGASATPGTRITAPAAVVVYPSSIAFDQTYARGRDKVEGQVVVFIGRPNEPQTRDLLTRFADGDGPDSVKALLEDDPANQYTTCDTVSINSVEIDVYDHEGVPHVVAAFDYVIYGPGEE